MNFVNAHLAQQFALRTVIYIFRETKAQLQKKLKNWRIFWRILKDQYICMLKHCCFNKNDADIYNEDSKVVPSSRIKWLKIPRVWKMAPKAEKGPQQSNQVVESSLRLGNGSNGQKRTPAVGSSGWKFLVNGKWPQRSKEIPSSRIKWLKIPWGWRERTPKSLFLLLSFKIGYHDPNTVFVHKNILISFYSKILFQFGYFFCNWALVSRKIFITVRRANCFAKCALTKFISDSKKVRQKIGE